MNSNIILRYIPFLTGSSSHNSKRYLTIANYDVSPPKSSIVSSSIYSTKKAIAYSELALNKRTIAFLFTLTSVSLLRISIIFSSKS